MKFVVDGMLGSFTRWLRLLGYEAEYFRSVSDDVLLERTAFENAILVTKDVELLKRARARGLQAFLAEGEDEAERLSNVATQLDLRLNVDEVLSRCPSCGSSLKRVDVNEVRDRVREGTLRRYREFWVCIGCGKAYWRGSHWKKINETLAKAKSLKPRMTNSIPRLPVGGSSLSFELTLDEGTYLVKLARQAISDYLKSRQTLPVPRDIKEKLKQKCGVFVTLNTLKEGTEELRGCIGYPTPELSLVEATIDAAISAAIRDPRFPPVEKDELEKIIVEVSALTQPSLIKVQNPRDYPHEVEIGRDGLIVEQGWYKGLLLPQVPVEWDWDCEEFLGHCCMKAGLPPEAWILPETKIFKFSCIIAKETSPNGPVVLITPEDLVRNARKEKSQDR